MGLIIGNRDCFWQDLKIPFEIPGSIFPNGSETRQNILDAIKHINDKTEVQLFDRKGRSDISDYIEFRLSDNLNPQGQPNSCNSPVGKQGGRQVLRCDATNVGTLIHELGHAIGLRHEHQRPDRDDFVTIDLKKAPTGLSLSNYDKRDDLMFGSYDFKSVMHYRGAEMSSKVSGVTLGSRELSNGDIAAINAMKNAGFLSVEKDASSVTEIQVQSVEGVVPVRKGDFKKILVPSNRFFWYSGDTREWTTASPGTNVIMVYRKRTGRGILWFCYNDPKQNSSKLTYLGTEHDKCSSPTLKVFGKETVSVAKGKTVRVDIGDNDFKWRCGDSNEQSSAPNGTNVLFVTRARTGRDITWSCYRKD